MEGNDGTDRNAPNYRSLAAKVKSDCFVGSGVTGENYVQVFKDVAAANPTVKLYGPDGVAEEAFTNPAKGGIPADVGARTKITVATLGLEEFKKRNNAKAEKFFTDYKTTYGTAQPDPYAIYGYETMSLALASLKAVGDKANDREAVAGSAAGEHQGPPVGPRRVLHRRERRHHADRLRALHHQGRAADVRQGHQGPGGLIARDTEDAR